MSDSLRDQLLKAGFAPSRKQAPRAPEKHGEPGGPALRGGKPKHAREEIDLGRAFAIRAQIEKAERETAERAAQQQAQERRERKRRLHELLGGNALAIPAEAEHVRHFEHAGKIRRIHVGAEQLASLNRGDLGVVVQSGRFVLVTREIALRVREFAPDAVVLLIDPAAPAGSSDDGVPDDLMW